VHACRDGYLHLGHPDGDEEQCGGRGQATEVLGSIKTVASLGLEDVASSP
jgi:hypothetical protein